MPYQLKTKTFEGPLEKLLELIEERKLGINEVSIAEVTDSFLKYLEMLMKQEKQATNDPVSMALLADFVSVASRLILLKSKSLLPDLTLTDEEEHDLKDLEDRLKLYARVKEAMKLLEEEWGAKRRMASRGYFLHTNLEAHVFYPGDGVTPQALALAMRGVFDELQKFTHETETIKDKIVSLEEVVKTVIARISELGGETSVAKLSGKKSRSELIMVFLAVLHLAREQLIHLEQESHFSDIIVKNRNKES